jgi:hypothetical protein
LHTQASCGTASNTHGCSSEPRSASVLLLLLLLLPPSLLLLLLLLLRT